MPVGTLKPEEADQKVVEAARLLVGNMVRARPYMMVIEDDTRQTVVGHFHTLHDIRIYARRNKLPKFTVWTQVSSSRIEMEEDEPDEFDEYEDEYEDEEDDDETLESSESKDEDDAEEEADDDEIEDEYDDDVPPMTDDLDDLLGTDLPDLEEGEELDTDDGVL